MPRATGPMICRATLLLAYAAALAPLARADDPQLFLDKAEVTRENNLLKIQRPDV